MLTRGNTKLGLSDIWGFGLPSGDPAVCVGMTPVCSKYCYAKRLESMRPSVKTAYTRNLEATKSQDFVDSMVNFVRFNRIKIVRVHTAGEFYSADYVKKWMAISTRLPRVMFYAYTRSWRVLEIRKVLERLGRKSNWQLWYSADKDTGIPPKVLMPIRVAWLMSTVGDEPSGPVDLVFRTQFLRRTTVKKIAGAMVCPVENGVTYRQSMTCESCTVCWSSAKSRDLSPVATKRLALTLV